MDIPPLGPLVGHTCSKTIPLMLLLLRMLSLPRSSLHVHHQMGHLHRGLGVPIVYPSRLDIPFLCYE